MSSRNLEQYARLLMSELEELGIKYGLTYFEERDLDKVIGALDEIEEAVLGPIMKDEKARIGLACTLVTLLTMEDIDGIIVMTEEQVEEFLENPAVTPTKAPTKKKQTTH